MHKATHHFDLINWWIDSIPQTVYAQGDLLFYGRENAAARGETYSYDRYTGEEAAADDPFALSLDSDETLQNLYLNAEADSGYLRDRNVFGDNITAEDTMSVTARYRNGIILSYSLLAYSPWEGYRAAVTGDRGPHRSRGNRGRRPHFRGRPGGNAARHRQPTARLRR